jgi:hypothetical protein
MTKDAGSKAAAHTSGEEEGAADSSPSGHPGEGSGGSPAAWRGYGAAEGAIGGDDALGLGGLGNRSETLGHRFKYAASWRPKIHLM